MAIQRLPLKDGNTTVPLKDGNTTVPLKDGNTTVPLKDGNTTVTLESLKPKLIKNMRYCCLSDFKKCLIPIIPHCFLCKQEMHFCRET